MGYTILLYYKYVSVRSPEKLRERQIALCRKLHLSGRIIISKEGINGTLEGTSKDVARYIRHTREERGFADIDFKKSPGTGTAFPRLSIKVRDEIVTLGLGAGDVNPRKITGIHLLPAKLKSWIDKKKDITIVDMRNDYEQKVGYFEGSVLPGMKNFRDLPAVLPRLKKFQNKTVVTVCTGGVRCEKASGFLKANGFKKVYQLHGGIVRYMEQFPAEDFKGKLYVFDGRITMSAPNGKKETEVVGRCYTCNKLSERYVNCANNTCHEHVIICDSCREMKGDFCSARCRKSGTLTTIREQISA